MSLDCNRSVLLKQKNISPDVEHLRVFLRREADVRIKKIKRKRKKKEEKKEKKEKKKKEKKKKK